MGGLLQRTPLHAGGHGDFRPGQGNRAEGHRRGDGQADGKTGQGALLIDKPKKQAHGEHAKKRAINGPGQGDARLEDRANGAHAKGHENGDGAKGDGN